MFNGCVLWYDFCTICIFVFQEFAPCDDELLAYRKGEEWDPLQGKAQAQISVSHGTHY